MAHGTPDLSDLLAVFEEQPVATTLHQISSGLNANLPLGSSNLPFNPSSLPFTELDPQAQFSQIPELDNDLSSGTFLSNDTLQAPAPKAFECGSGGGGSLGSLFLSSIEHQLDTGNSDNAPFVQPIPQPDVSKVVSSKPRQSQQQTNSSQQIRNAGLPQQHFQRASVKSSYSKFGNNIATGLGSVALHTTALSPDDLTAKSSHTGLDGLPFIMPTEVQPPAPHAQIGGVQKKGQSGQFGFRHHGPRQQSLPTNPPRPLSAASNTSEHLSRPGSVQQPSPSCGSSHSGDPATPLTPQSYNAGTPQPYKPATPGSNTSMQQQRRNPGYGDVHHSPQISQSTSLKIYGANQPSGMGYQTQQQSSTQSMISSSGSLGDLPTPIKDVFEPGITTPFHTPTDSIDTNCLWNPSSALMEPSALFVSSSSTQLSSTPALLSQSQNLGFGISNDLYGVGLPSYTTRIPPRSEANFGETLTAKQNEILDQLSSSGLKKSSGQSAQLNQEVASVNECIQSNTTRNAATMDMMNKANNAGHATVEKLLGTQYEAISPVSDHSMSPTRKSTLPEELADNIFSSSKFPPQTEISMHHQSQTSINRDITDPVLMYTTKKDNTHITQKSMPELIGPDSVPDLISYADNDWSPRQSVPIATPIVKSQRGSPSVPASLPSNLNVNVSRHGHDAMDLSQWMSNNVNILPPDYGVITVTRQSDCDELRSTQFQPTSCNETSQTLSPSLKQSSSHGSTRSLKEGKLFGVSRNKPCSEKSKGLCGNNKMTGSSDAAFGFESDDDTETICLNKVPPTAFTKKTPAKPQPQLNVSSVKPRLYSNEPSDDLRLQMETVKQLQQQRLRLQQMRAYQSQNASNGNLANPNYGKHFQNKVQQISVSDNQAHHDRLRNKNVIETPITGVSHITENVVSYPDLHAFSTVNSMIMPKAINVSAPLSYPQSNPNFDDTSRYKHSPRPILSQSQPLFSSSKANAPILPNLFETIQKAHPGSVGVAAGSAPIRAQATQPQISMASHSSVFYSSNPTSASTMPSQIPALLSPSPWKTNVVSSSVSSLSTPAVRLGSKISTNQMAPTDSSLTTTSQTADNAILNLEWFSREPERIEKERYASARLDFSNAVTPPNATNPTTLRLSARAETPQVVSSVCSGLPSTKKSLLPEDDLIPLKQSIHTVDHLSISRTHPVVPSTYTPPAVTKKHPTTETRHLNFKKHRILEGALPCTNVKSMSNTTSSSALMTVSESSVTVAHSVLDKQRRYVKEHSHSKPKHRIPPHQVQGNIIPSSVPMVSSKEKVPDSREATPSTNENKANEKDNSKQGDKSGMLMLFNSLLLEASQSALKSKIGSTEEESAKKTAGEGVVPKVSKSQTAPVSQPNMVTKSNATVSNKVVSSVPVQLPNKPAVTATTIIQTTVTSNTASEIKKPAKKNWSSSVMPFKRRYFDDAQSQLAAVSGMSTTVTAAKSPVATSPKLISSVPKSTVATSSTIVSVTSTSIKPRSSTASVTSSLAKPRTSTATVATSVPKPKTSTTSATSSVAKPRSSHVTVPSTSVKSTPSIVSTSSSVKPNSSTVSVTAAVSKLTSLKTTVSNRVSAPIVSVAVSSPIVESMTPVATGGALKLRITAFRSTRGDIIHQSAMLSKNEDGAGSNQSAHKRSKKKKRKKKDKKRRSKTSSSDENSLVSIQPAADRREKLIEKAKLNEQITKELVEIAKITTVEENAGTAPKPNPQKRKRTKGGIVDTDADGKKPPKRARVSKSSLKKKQESKTEEPVARYLPKSMLQANSVMLPVSSVSAKVTVSVPPAYQRARGKLPLYLSSSEKKSSTTPTIQLVARNSSKVASSVSENKKTPPSKVMNVKISKAISSRTFSTQLLPNSNVQYIIPSSRSQPRIILPNVTSSSTAGSVASPTVARPFSGGGIVPIPSSSSSVTPSTKPQLFTFPLTLNDSASHTLKNITEKTKTRSENSASSSSPHAVFQSSAVKPSTTSGRFLATEKAMDGLTGTLDSPRLSTKVLSSDSSQDNANNFQSVLLKLITSPNPVTNYIPPEPPAMLGLEEKETVQCLACEDRFLVEECLEDHHARRSILIKVRCMQCDRDMVFLNKCKLLMHARQHSDGMQFNNAHISPLPVSMCKPRSKEWFLNNKKVNGHFSPQRKSSIDGSEGHSPTTAVTENSATFPTVLACTDCNFVGSTAKALEEHFQRTSPPVSPDKSKNGTQTAQEFVCDICSVSVPNQCSFLAHMRMHKRSQPHTCPECGQTFDNAGLQEYAYSESRKEIDFNLHLSVQCFHLSRISAYKCRICNLICKNAEMLRRHLEDKHLQTFYKCRDCPMAFKTPENIASHQRSAHGVVAVTKMIHKCPLCDTVFTDSNATQQMFLLQKHFDGHMSHPSIHITAYKCLFCNQIYERKLLLRDHLKAVHDVAASGDNDLNDSKGLLDSHFKSKSLINKRKRSLADSTDCDSPRKISRILSSGDSSTSNALIASGALSSREGVKKKSNVIVSSGDLNLVRKNAKQPLKLRLKGLGSHVPQVSKQVESPELSPIESVESIMRDGRKVFPCGQCPKEWPSASARINHIRLKHQGIRTLFCCPYCPTEKIKFAKNISMKKHLKKVHGMNEITKQDIRIEYVKLPIGQRFDRTVLNSEDGNASPPTKRNSSTERKVRKKFTRPGRRPNRMHRQVRQDVDNSNVYPDNSDGEVERIMSNNVVDDAVVDKTDVIEDVDFSVLKFPDFYTCAKCEHKCEDRLEFQAHILEHKEDAEAEGISGTNQCTECGLCFASDSSHVKHLFIKHKIRKKKLLEKYDEQLKEARKAEGRLPQRLNEDLSNDPAGASDSNLKKHKCSVCFKRFEDDSRLKVHLRTHGLAFVKSKHTS